MIIPKSKLGLIFVTIFIIITIIFLILRFSGCDDEICLYSIAFTALPWIYIYSTMESILFFWVAYTITIVLNGIIVYFIGYGIQRILKNWLSTK